MGYAVERNQVSQPLTFLMVLSSDHITGATGVSPTVTISKNGGAYATPSGAVTEIGNGMYSVAANATDANTLGPLLLHATAALCDPRDDTFQVVLYNPGNVQPLSPPTTATSGTTTAQDIIKGALQIIGALGQRDPLDSADAQDGLRRLNNMIDAWRIHQLLIYHITRSTYDLVASQALYTVGAGGNWDQTRPDYLTGAELILTDVTPNTELRLARMTHDEYRRLPQKSLESSQPTAFYYNATFPTAEFIVWPVPDNATYDVALYWEEAIGGFTSITTQYAFPPGYAEAIEYNLAKRLSVPYGRRLEPDVREQAREGLALIKRKNTRLRDIYSDVGAIFGGPSAYNIFAGP